MILGYIAQRRLIENDLWIKPIEKETKDLRNITTNTKMLRPRKWLEKIELKVAKRASHKQK